MTRVPTRGRARRLRVKVELQKPTIPTDGATTATFATIDTVYAEIVSAAARGAAGQETGRGDEIEARTSWVITIRYRDDVTPAWRIKWGTRLLNIQSAYDPDNRRRDLVMLGKEVVA